MKEIELHLVPAPGAKPEFLATVQPVLNDDDDAAAAIDSTTKVWDAVGNKVILEGYTRDGWAWKPISSSQKDSAVWTALTVESVDGRNKLPGFVGYLKERQKSAYGRFQTAGVWVVSYVQSKQKSNPNNRIDVRIALDLTLIPHCTLEPLKAKPSATNPPQREAQSWTNSNSSTRDGTPSKVGKASATASDATTTTTRKTGGLLGKLVGAQQRTNEYVAIANAKTRKVNSSGNTSGSNNAATATASANGNMSSQSQSSHNPTTTIAYKTVPEVFAAFRQACQSQMLDFDLADDEVLKVPIVLSEQLQWLETTEEKQKVTMDVLKYIVYEAAEEVNNEWVAHKEASEYVDDVVIAVYKEGAAPPDVLEEINKGELPDEIRGQQRALQEQRVRQVTQKQKGSVDINGAPYIHGDDEDDEDDGLEALNTKKRDRRTIADFEREKLQAGSSSSAKRSR